MDWIYMCLYVHLNEEAEAAHAQMHISEQLNATKHILNEKTSETYAEVKGIVFDTVLFCSGFGVTLNICTWKSKGGDVCVHV